MVKRVSRIRNLLNSDFVAVHSNQISSSQESSETENIDEEKPWPPVDHLSRCKTMSRLVTRREPRPHSHLFKRGSGDGKERRSRHARRWENSAYLSSLHVVSEDDVLTTPFPVHYTPFTQLHSSEKHMQIWASFSSQSEEEQQSILDGHVTQKATPTRGGESAEDNFKRIDRRIRSVLHHKHVPLDILESFESEFCSLFSIDSGAVVLTTHPHSFSRLLLHGLCQYMRLQSTTVSCEDISVVMVTCRVFDPPTTSLSKFLQSS